MFTIKEFKKVESLEEAWTLNQKRTNRIAGGMLWMRMKKNPVMTLIDLSGLGLNQIEETEEEFRIGCMTTLRQLEMDEGLNVYTNGAMREAVHHIIGVQFRNLATIGGSIFGRFGFSDVLTVFMTMDSYVELYKGGIIPLCEFAQMKPDNDVLVRVIVKKEAGRFAYQSVRTNASTDFPVLTCSGAKLADGSYRIAIGARPQRAVLLKAAETICGKEHLTDEDMEVISQKAREEIRTLSNHRGSAAYRTHLVGVMTKRVLKELEGVEA